MVKKTFMMLWFTALLFEISFSQSVIKPRKVTVTFKLDLSKEIKNVTAPFTIGIRGNTPPLSWDKTYPITDIDKNGIYETAISFEISAPVLNLEYKYFHEHDTWESTGNRTVTIRNTKTILPIDIWNDGPPASVVASVNNDSIMKALFHEIAFMDSVLFTAYNTRDLEKLKTLFTQDLEFYHDKGGLTNYEQNIAAFREILGRNNGIKRTLVKGSLEVYPVKDYGAMEIGAHTFCHIENGEEDCGTFKFVMIWKKENDGWKISRVVSYDH